VVLKLNGTHHHLAYAEDVYLLADNVDPIKKSTETLIYSSEEVGPEINIEKLSILCYLFTRMQSKSGHKNSEQII
jgi:hypothetical protein